MTPPKPSIFLVLTPDSETENSSMAGEWSLAVSVPDSLPQADNARAKMKVLIYFIAIT
jgi:hypothetical protein